MSAELEPAAGRGGGVVDGEAADVPVRPGGLHRQELGVQARQLPHRLSSSRMATIIPARHGAGRNMRDGMIAR